MEPPRVTDADRLKRLASYELPDGALPPELERVARLAADLFDAPMAGFAFDPGAVAAAPDDRPHFFAAADLTTPDGHNLGSLYIMDDRARPPFNAAETARLQTLAEIAGDALELRRMTCNAAGTERAIDLVKRLATAGRQAGGGWPVSAGRVRRAS